MVIFFFQALKKMADDIPEVTKNILPDQKLDCVAYGCTSGTIAIGEDKVKEKILTSTSLSDINESCLLEGVKHAVVFLHHFKQVVHTALSIFLAIFLSLDQ